MNRYIGQILPALILIGSICLPVVAQDGIVISLKKSDYPYSDSHLAEKIGMALSPFKDVYIVEVPNCGGPPEKMESLISIGKEHKARFLAEICIDNMDMVRKKTTIVPLFLYRYRVYGAISGTLRIIDVAKERVIQLEKINVDALAVGQWQILDDDPNDPALFIPADAKITLFGQLEDEIAAQFWEKIKRLTRGNSFGG
jgi:hypothetical protein